MTRNLTRPEIHLLSEIFKATLRYEAIRCGITNVGGVEGITPAGAAYFSRRNYCDDFSKAGEWEQWLFVHEMAHIWQWGHHMWPAIQAICPFIKYGGIYNNAYFYDLTPGKKLTDYNIEQQASIVADYWILFAKKKLKLQRNNNIYSTPSDYTALVAQLRNSGPSIRKLDQVPI